MAENKGRIRVARGKYNNIKNTTPETGNLVYDKDNNQLYVGQKDNNGNLKQVQNMDAISASSIMVPGKEANLHINKESDVLEVKGNIISEENRARAYGWVVDNTFPTDKNFYGWNVWVYDDEIYLSENSSAIPNTFKLNKTTHEWEDAKQWLEVPNYWIQYKLDNKVAYEYDWDTHQFIKTADTTPLSGKKYFMQEYAGSTGTPRYFPALIGSCIWIDNANNLCCDFKDTHLSRAQYFHYILDKSINAWVIKNWEGFTSWDKHDLWTYGNEYYISTLSQSSYNHYKISGNNIQEFTWSGFTDFQGSGIWEYNGVIYYNTKYKLNGTTWENSGWDIYLDNIWTDGYNYYANVPNPPKQYKLNKNTGLWELFTWNNINRSIYDEDIWKIGNTIYYRQGRWVSDNNNYILTFEGQDLGTSARPWGTLYGNATSSYSLNLKPNIIKLETGTTQINLDTGTYIVNFVSGSTMICFGIFTIYRPISKTGTIEQLYGSSTADVWSLVYDMQNHKLSVYFNGNLYESSNGYLMMSKISDL